MADQHHPTPVDAGEAADDRRVVGERAVAGQRQEILGEPCDIILEMRPVAVPRDLRLLPRSELGVGVAKQLIGLGLELRDLGTDVDVVRACGGLAQLGDTRLKLGDGLLEIEVI